MAIDNDGVVDRKPITDKPNEHRSDGGAGSNLPKQIPQTSISDSGRTVKCQ